MRPNVLDVIKVLKPLPDVGIELGARGVIITIFDSPEEAYEVEFPDEKGRASTQAVLYREDFEIV